MCRTFSVFWHEALEAGVKRQGGTKGRFGSCVQIDLVLQTGETELVPHQDVDLFVEIYPTCRPQDSGRSFQGGMGLARN